MEYISKDRIKVGMSPDISVIRNAKRVLKKARKEFTKMRPMMVVTGTTVARMSSLFNDFIEDYNQHHDICKRVSLVMDQDGLIYLKDAIAEDYTIFQK